MSDRVIDSATCLGCGCTCDDIEVHVTGDRISEARHACEMGIAWFGDGRAPARASIGGDESSTSDALDAAAHLLAGAKRPLIYLAPDLSCEAQKEAIATGDALHATIDSITSTGALASVLAAQERGRVAATLGEIRNRADVIVFWGVDPDVRYPRYRARYAPEPAGVHVPEGRRSRKVIAVDIGQSNGPADADVRIAIQPDDETPALTALAAVSRGAMPPSDVGITGDSQGADSDVYTAWSIARELAPSLMQAHYVVIVADAEARPTEARDPDRASALIALAQALNGPTRCALSTLRGGGNRSGADAVLTSQTGFPCAVDFARGFPQYRPHDGAADTRLSNGEVDAALVIGSVARLPSSLVAQLADVPCAVIGPFASESVLARAQAVIDTGVAGIHEGGTAVRMDEVPLPLRPAIDGLRSAADTIRALRERIVVMK